MIKVRSAMKVLFVLGVSLLQQSYALAQEAEEAASEGMLGSWFGDGGPVMWVILLASIFGTLIFLERAFDLYHTRRLDADAFCAQVIKLVDQRQYSAALKACDVGSRHPVTNVMRAGLMRANRREKEIERAMEKEMLNALPKLQKRVSFLALLANTATLVGLLGTIFGLITAFNSVAAASAAERQEALAAGISQAMYTTAFGISVAVPLLFFHHFVSKRQENILLEVEEGASGLLVALAGKRDDGSSSGFGGGANLPPVPAE